MKTIEKKKLYEGMFLVDSAKAASDWDGIIAVIKKILERAGAEIVSMRKWDDRKLAYDIRGVGRGTYVLCYFKVEGQKIQGIEKAVQLSEKIMRALILSTEQMTKEDIEKETPAAKAEKEKQKTIPEQPQGAETIEQSDQQEESLAEQDQIFDEAQAAEDIEQAQETDETEVIEKVEEDGETEVP